MNFQGRPFPNPRLRYNAYVIVLSIDTCDSRGSIALLRDDVAVALEPHESAEDYSSWLLPAVGRALAKGKVVLTQVGLFSVAVGPGSFTGLRVGLTTVKAWAEVFRRPVASVSRLEAVALQAWGGTEYVASAIDASRCQVFGAIYRRNSTGLSRLTDEMVIAPKHFLEHVAELAGGERVAWASPDPECLLDQPGWKERKERGDSFEPVSGSLPIAIARIGVREYEAGRTTDALGLDANYVRRSDAEIFWKGAAHGH